MMRVILTTHREVVCCCRARRGGLAEAGACESAALLGSRAGPRPQLGACAFSSQAGTACPLPKPQTGSWALCSPASWGLIKLFSFSSEKILQVDVLKATALPLLKQFGIDGESFELKVRMCTLWVVYMCATHSPVNSWEGCVTLCVCVCHIERRH